MELEVREEVGFEATAFLFSISLLMRKLKLLQLIYQKEEAHQQVECNDNNDGEGCCPSVGSDLLSRWSSVTFRSVPASANPR